MPEPSTVTKKGKPFVVYFSFKVFINPIIRTIIIRLLIEPCLALPLITPMISG